MENPYLRAAFSFLTAEADHFDGILVSWIQHKLSIANTVLQGF